MNKLAAIGGLLLAVVCSLAVHAKPLNVLILYADDLGFGDVAAQNSASKIPTPNLDRLAASGLRFTDGHSSSGICSPSRYALLTGRHHWRDFHGIVGPLGGSVFKPGRLTLPEMLKQKGYTTAAVGKWHLGWDWDAIRKPADEVNTTTNQKAAKPSISFDAFDWSQSVPDGPLAHGFGSYFGDTVINFPPYGWIENDRLVKAPDTMMDTGLWKKIKEGNWECRPGPMVSDWDPYQNIPTTTQRGVDYIKAQQDATEPWFLYFAFPSPHAPIIPNDEFDGKSQAGPYGDFVVETDDAVGRLLAALEETGQADDTIVIFSADNGPEQYAYARDQNFDHWSAAPFRGLKRDIYEGGHHIPFMLRWPGITKPGEVSTALVSQIDIMATLAEMLDYQLPDDAAEDSHSLLPLLKGRVQSVRTTHVHNTAASKWAIRHDDWLLIDGKDGYHSRRNAAWEKKHGYPADDDGPIELYNLKDDIGQRHDLASQRPAKVKELSLLLKTIREQGHSAPRLAEKVAASDPVVPKPTLVEVRYGEHERHVLDLWQADSKMPTPLVLVIHGGGWQGGTKERVGRFVDVQQLLDAGISVAAINYRLINHANEAGIRPPVNAPLHDAARALQFIRSKAGEWNIDKERIGAAGGSAGACSSLWLAFHDDLAETDSNDPIARESTRLWCAAVRGAQTSLDPQQMQEWTPNSRYGAHAFGLQGFAQFLAERQSILPWIAEYSPYALVTEDDPPVYLIYTAPPAIGLDQKDPTHTSNFGVKLQEHCTATGVNCQLVYPGAPDVSHETPTDYLIGELKSGLQLSSPLDYQVFQRRSREHGTMRIAGSLAEASSLEPTIEARLNVPGNQAEWRRIEAVFDGTAFQETAFEAQMVAPVGGWHHLQVRALQGDRVVGEATIEHVGIGEVFVVAGQSNSANHGEELQAPVTDRVVNFDGERWQIARDPQPGASGRRGSMLPPLGDALVQQFDVPIGFIACGIGATSVREWLPRGTTFPNPPTLESRVEQLADGQWASKSAAFETFVSRMKSVTPHGFRAVLWHQGESDANQKDASRTLAGKLYREYLEQLIRDSRREIGWEAPWFVAQVSYHRPDDEASPEIRAAQASLWRDGVALEGPDSDALTGDLRERNGQGVHFSAKGLREHAARWANKVGPWLEQKLENQ